MLFYITKQLTPVTLRCTSYDYKKRQIQAKNKRFIKTLRQNGSEDVKIISDSIKNVQLRKNSKKSRCSTNNFIFKKKNKNSLKSANI